MTHRYTALFILFYALLYTAPARASSAFVVLQRISQPTIVMTEVSSDEAYDPAVLTRLWSYDANGTPTITTHHANAHNITLSTPPNTAAILLQADFGFHARRPQDTHWSWQRKTALPGATIGLHTIKESVNLQASAARNQQPHGLAVDIIPLIDPFTLHRRDHLPLQVLFNGKPLPNVRVNENFSGTLAETTAPTDQQGKTTATLHADQVNILQITYEHPVTNDPDVDVMRYNSALTFNLAHAEP